MIGVAQTELEIFTGDEAPVVLQRARELADAVKDEATYAEAGEFLTTVIKPYLKRLDDTFRPLIQQSDAHTKALRELHRRIRVSAETAETYCKERFLAFEEAEAKRRRIEEARLMAEAEEEQRRAYEAEAELLEKAGDEEAAEQVREEAASAPPPRPVVVPVERPRGVQIRETWNVRVTDVMALVKAVAEGKVPLTAVAPNMAVIRKVAQAARKDFAWAGCEAYPEKGVGARAR